jgi:glycosyltransferase involved in cell wall biosynthesis
MTEAKRTGDRRRDFLTQAPTVSVITICRNDAEGLRRTLKSVSSQTYASIEHVIVDALSEDDTGDVLREARAGNCVVVSELDAGRYDGMNKGVNLAQGELLWFLHSGDTFGDSRCVERVVERYRARRFEWGYGCSRVVDVNGSLIGIGALLPYRRGPLLLGMRSIPHQAAVFRRDFFLALGGYDIAFGLAADQLFMIRAGMASTPAVWADFLCNFEGSGAGSTRPRWAHYRDRRRARRRLGVTASGSSLADDVVSIALVTASTVLTTWRRRRGRNKVANRG